MVGREAGFTSCLQELFPQILCGTVLTTDQNSPRATPEEIHRMVSEYSIIIRIPYIIGLLQSNEKLTKLPTLINPSIKHQRNTEPTVRWTSHTKQTADAVMHKSTALCCHFSKMSKEKALENTNKSQFCPEPLFNDKYSGLVV